MVGVQHTSTVPSQGSVLPSDRSQTTPSASDLANTANMQHDTIAKCILQCRQAAAAVNGRGILVLGSVNMDITVDVARLPLKGETTTSISPSVSLAVGGKVRMKGAPALTKAATPTKGGGAFLPASWAAAVKQCRRRCKRTIHAAHASISCLSSFATEVSQHTS